MVHIIAAAHAAAAAYAVAIGSGANYSIPLPSVAAEVSSFFLPNYTAFSLGTISALQSRETIEQSFTSLYNLWREKGQPGTNVHVIKTRVQSVSDQSALCWLTFCVEPVNGMQSWEWRNLYGFRLVKGGLENGQAGGWEFAVADGEQEEYAKRFPSKT